jgi:putative PIN family toxin of toxin-antitoxin system
MSAATVEELKQVLARSKFDRYLSAEARSQFATAIARGATVLEPDEAIDACRDPKDNKFLEIAVAGKAAYIISGDKDLLILNPFRGIQIVTPAEFLEMIEDEPGAKTAE